MVCWYCWGLGRWREGGGSFSCFLSSLLADFYSTDIILTFSCSHSHTRFHFFPPQVGELKARIESELNLGEPASQKLIFSGKILKDDQTLGSAKVKEGDFIVIMVSKARVSRLAGGGQYDPVVWEMVLY